MRKMMNKKGFTLVELMIVVVILGILVAIAVPIFGAVTKNAKRKACASNIRIIEGNCSTYLTTGASDGGAITSAGLASTGAASFTTLFKDGVPKCQSATGGTTYSITFTDENDTVKYSVKCMDTACPNYITTAKSGS